MEIYNLTPFPVLTSIMMDSYGEEKLITITKATWQIHPDGKLTPADEQMPILSAPVYRGVPDSSSLLYESDIVLQKIGTDCILIGHAYAPKTGIRHTYAGISIGPLLKTVRVYGERRWEKVLGAFRMRVGPLPFEKIPLVYERAFGGIDKSNPDPVRHEVCAENPVGRGFIARHSDKDWEYMLFPNVEYPKDLYKSLYSRPKPAGFGAIAPYWKPRVDFSGTRDENCQKNVSFLPPANFNPEYFNCASPGLIARGFLRGDEHVGLGHLTPGRILRFSLPGVRPTITLKLGNSNIDLDVFLDTVIVEPDDMRVQMAWRAPFDISGKIHKVKQIKIATAT